VKSKLNNIRRFFTLLFTDKDISENEDVSTHTIEHIDEELTLPEWSLQSEGVEIPTEDVIYNVEPENI
jgi:hypothetical protein